MVRSKFVVGMALVSIKSFTETRKPKSGPRTFLLFSSDMSLFSFHVLVDPGVEVEFFVKRLNITSE